MTQLQSCFDGVQRTNTVQRLVLTRMERSMEAILRPTSSIGILDSRKASNLSQSRGSLTAAALVTDPAPHPISSIGQSTGSPSVESPIIGSPSAGSALLEYSRRLIAAGGSQPIVDAWRFVYLVPSAAESSFVAQPETVSAVEALQEIVALTGLSKAAIADQLLDVSRMSINNWERGHTLSIANESNIRGMLDVLQRAAKRNHAPNQMRGWLYTPVGSRGVRPIDLLRSGKIDEARMLAVTTADPRLAPIPSWVNRPIPEEWTGGAEHRRDAYPEHDDDSVHPGESRVE